MNDRPRSGSTFVYKQRPQPYIIPFEMLIAHLEARGPSSTGWYSGKCPAHDDRHPSLGFTTRGGKLGFKCQAGCKHGKIVAVLEERGLWPVDIDGYDHPSVARQTGLPQSLIEFNAKLTRAADGYRVRAYLAARGIDVRALNNIMTHHSAYHWPSGQWWPCMVAAVQDVDGKLRSLHQTFLSYTDPPVKAPVIKPRLFWKGPEIGGCAIRLAPAAPKMLIGEGIETTASAMQHFGLPGWAAGGSGLESIELPKFVTDVLIAADNDEAGRKLAIAAAQRFRREGRTVRIERPKHVKDFNDYLLMRHNHVRS